MISVVGPEQMPRRLLFAGQQCLEVVEHGQRLQRGEIVNVEVEQTVAYL